MATTKKGPSELLDITFQAICRSGDFDGNITDEDTAYEEADGHHRTPGCQFHIIDVVRIKKSRRVFKAK